MGPSMSILILGTWKKQSVGVFLGKNDIFCKKQSVGVFLKKKRFFFIFFKKNSPVWDFSILHQIFYKVQILTVFYSIIMDFKILSD